MGIRAALGADRANLIALFVRDGARLTLLAIVISAPLTMAVGRLIDVVVDGFPALDVLTLVAMTSALVTVALIATYTPARRGSRLEPMSALRTD